MNTALLDMAPPDTARARNAGTALWVFIGVASTLFSLFLVAYAMRMDQPDWSPIVLPPQVLLSTACLVAASVLLQAAAGAARRGAAQPAWRWLLAAGAATAAFLASQLWAWQALLDARVVLASNPAASFFYLLTALHGLHVLGGLVAWGSAAQAQAAGDPAAPWRIALCARYWHFLLLLWCALGSALAWLTPEIGRALCGTG
jgi:cytochrome c oxidase subunit 3